MSWSQSTHCGLRTPLAFFFFYCLYCLLLLHVSQFLNFSHGTTYHYRVLVMETLQVMSRVEYSRVVHV